jgi:hypothetical protein
MKHHPSHLALGQRRIFHVAWTALSALKRDIIQITSLERTLLNRAASEPAVAPLTLRKDATPKLAITGTYITEVPSTKVAVTKHALANARTSDAEYLSQHNAINLATSSPSRKF